MLLGLDFLLRHGVDIKLEELYLDFSENGERVSVGVERKATKENKVAKVMIEKKLLKYHLILFLDFSARSQTD